ncbi:MAG: sulfatase [Pseudomonadota bacterium]
MLRLFATFAILNALLLGLEIPRHGGFGPNWVALEALVLAGLFTLMPPGRWSRGLAGVAASLLALLSLLALADGLARMSLGRSLNLYLDYPLIRSVYHLMAGSVSVPGAIAAGVALLLVVTGLALFVRWLLLSLPAPRSPIALAAGVAMLAAGIAGTTAFHAGTALPSLPRAITPGATLVLDQLRFGRSAHSERREFEALLADEPDAGRATPLPGLDGIDVIIGFIESYGVSALFDDRYARVVGKQLEAIEQDVAAAGLHMVSGTLNAPMFGGQSWLAHASLLTGLRVRNQMHYEFLLGTQRASLVQDFQQTGHRTLAVMPAITRPWPEGRWYGYDEIHEASDIPYAGPEFNWVTMPDQFTWWHFEHSLRRGDDRPVFAKLALISSHAPWVPILPVIEDWDQIGDGSVFLQWEGEGETPESLWRNHDRVREHYALSVAYALETAGRYAARFTDSETLLILVGDHQPAPLITGADASPGVPVHVFSGAPELLEPFRDRGFVPGGRPPSEHTDAGMDRLRGWLQEAFGAPSPRER